MYMNDIEWIRTLFEIDTKDYDPQGRAFVRPSVRGIILRNGKVAMVHSLMYDYYKFPGGGIERGEDHRETLIREVREESGLLVLPETIRPYGNVPRRQKSDQENYDLFVQDNFYYFCEAEQNSVEQKLDDYEAEEHFTLEWVLPEYAIEVNRKRNHGPKEQMMLEREARVLELLIHEGYFSRAEASCGGKSNG